MFFLVLGVWVLFFNEVLWMLSKVFDRFSFFIRCVFDFIFSNFCF